MGERWVFCESVLLLGLKDVVCDGHAVVWFEYLGWSQPCIFGVSLVQLLLVIVESDQRLEVDGRGQLANLEI